MNDFTKEELEDILNWADVYTEAGACWTYRLHEQLIKKIQSMIENYCEPKQIDGFEGYVDFTGCNHQWETLEQPAIATPTEICTKCRALHFIRV
jgi:hypothetical protein